MSHVIQKRHARSFLSTLLQLPMSILFRFAKNNIGTLAVIFSYFVIYITIIAKGNGLPYVMDNNESFSAITHAANLWNFDFFKSFGLADEAVSPFPAAPPVVHTHQGDFPRLFSFLLYAVGARSAEIQIWITTFTVGLASVLLTKSFFRRVAGDLFATIATLMLISDYLLFTQWQVNTYRVWHGFFLFGSLICVHGLSDWKRSRWVMATFILYACLFYWELVFAAFVAITAGTYAVWTYRRTPKLVLIAGTTQTLAAIFGLGVLFAQLILYLGWHDFLYDLKLTYLARNSAANLGITAEALQDFYAAKHVIFWPNFQNEIQFSGLSKFLDSIFIYVLQIKTPLFAFITLSLAWAAITASTRFPNASDTTVANSDENSAATLILIPALFALLLLLAFDSRAFLGQPTSFIAPNATPTFIVFLIAVAAAIGLRRIAAIISLNGTPPGIRRCTIGTVYILSLCGLALVQGFLYDQSQQDLWLGVLTPFNGWAATLVVAASAVIGLLFILVGTPSVLGRWRNVPEALLPFLVSSTLAYLFVYKFGTGYLYSGYLYRLCPLPVFHVDAFLALAPFASIATSVNLWGRVWNFRFRPSVVSTSVFSSALFVLIVGYWSFVQIRYFTILPPDQFAFTRMLKAIAAKGIVSDSYQVPLGFIAKTWAYMDPDFAKRGGRQDAQGALAPKSDFFWFADGQSNKTYQEPELFVCFKPFASYPTLIDSIYPHSHSLPRCSETGLYRQSTQNDGGFPKPGLILRDEVKDLWAIYRLQWRDIEHAGKKHEP